MDVRCFLMVIIFTVITSCGKVPLEPELSQERVEEAPFVMLPTVFRDAMVSEVFSDNLENTAPGHFYPDFVRAQRFEYDESLISGHLIDYGLPVDVLAQHSKIFGTESEIRTDNIAPLLRRFNVRLFIAQDGRPTLYLIAGPYVLHVTVMPDPNNREIATFLALLFAEEVINLNREVLTPPSYFVSLNLVGPPVPEWGAQVPAGDDLIVFVVLDYVLLDAAEGQITFELERDAPFVRQKKVVNVARGTGTVAFVGTLRFTPNIPDTGANVIARFVLSPPYIDENIVSSGAAEYGEDIGGGRFSHTAEYSIPYRLRK
jgi:hypothetical protein